MMISTIFGAALLASIPGESPALSVQHCALGQSYQFQVATCQFEFVNKDERPVRIERIAPASTSDEVSEKNLVIPANSTRRLTFTAKVGISFLVRWCDS